ncbi:MAG TPA: cation diffusion facilitator family transporter [Candidatus Methylacidiphilales bacterium]|nr:cation diffusion facilitator family transporter [Candidatus Methylacidiphilales bacterium]
MPTPIQSSEALEAARMNPERSLLRGRGSALRGILVNGGLGAAKLAAGIFGHSYTLVTDAAESFSDVMGSCITFYALKKAAEPPDPEHPSGHGRAETLASAITALALIGVGMAIFMMAAISLGEPRRAPSPLTLLVLVPVILIKEAMFHWMRARGKETGSLAVVAEAWHQRSDVVTSAAALGGITVAWVGGPGWSHADNWAAMLASFWLAVTGLWLLGPAAHELMEGSVDPALMDFILETGKNCEGVRGIDKVWVRKLGMRLMIDIHIEVDPDISVQEGHRLAHEVKDRLRRELPQVRDVMVHVEPFDEARQKRTEARRR